jgi:hypothetical protein
MLPTQRTYRNWHTGIFYRMYYNVSTDTRILIDEKTGNKISEFYCAAFNGIEYKFKDKSIISLCAGEFFTPYNTVGKPIGKRFALIQKNFKKI